MYANKIAYADDKFATWDAMLIGRLHCYVETWETASVKFLKSGGFVMSTLVPKVKQPVLVLWGAQDKILELSTADRFRAILPDNEVVVIDACGHVPHLEQPLLTASLINKFVQKQ